MVADLLGLSSVSIDVRDECGEDVIGEEGEAVDAVLVVDSRSLVDMRMFGSDCMIAFFF